SNGCKAEIAALQRAQQQKQAGACAADAEKLCKGVQPGGGRIQACLKQHSAELSPACTAATAGR
ncbi:MAG: cysteine rich repeat-containing protein, partial [Dongiaceae bacterium]